MYLCTTIRTTNMLMLDSSDGYTIKLKIIVIIVIIIINKFFKNILLLLLKKNQFKKYKRYKYKNLNKQVK